MNYEFVEKTLDDYELHYTNKDGKEVIKPFKRTVELAHKLQSGDAEARFKMLDYLTKMGKSKKDLIIERKDENGKIIVDETNYREFESSFILKEQYETAMKIYEELFGMNFVDLLLDMGLSEENSNEFEEKILPFSTELRELLINGKVKTPSNSNEKKDKQ